ncbi:MAG TPA: PLP-dependent aspartate aminotransferase family protein [Gammaproteobacteria bacterium]|nr:PLP-dependent aspartate aminotransferase family protein [Gammaproteobacteria bacterium]
MKKETRVTHPPEIKLLGGNVPVVTPVYRTVKFTFPTIESSLSAEAKESGFDYTRDSNPTTREVELTAAALQDRDDALATATGMAATWLALLGNLEAGDHAVLFVESYRPNRVAIRRFLSKLGIEFTMIGLHDHAAIEREFARDSTKLVLFEAPTNPMVQVPDLERITALARRHDVVTVLDNTFAGLHQHGRYDIDYFVHSMTKYASGHGDVMGGVVIADQKRIKALRPLAVNMGSTLDPGAAFLIGRGLKTYFLRYRQHSANAQAIAEFLVKRPEVAKVFYPGLPSDPGHALARKQMTDFGGVLSFDLRDSPREKTWAFIDALELFTTTASLGSTESLVAPAKLYLGSDLSAEEQKRALLEDSTVRLAVGIEHVDDLIADLTQALDKIFG